SAGTVTATPAAADPCGFYETGSVGSGHPLARLLLAAAALAAATAWEAGHRVTDLHSARRHHHERQARA
ncbi:hypothetical protein ACWC4J_31070, partial [Streptomyces sp. NPDC001356]